jgi:hypothetical protein
MKSASHLLASLLLGASSCAPLIADAKEPVVKKEGEQAAQDIFVQAFLAFREAERAAARGENISAQERLEHVGLLLETLRERWPNWQPDIVKFRLKKTHEMLGRLGAGLPR